MSRAICKRQLKEGEIIPLTFDYVFCNIFNNPDNIIILENFLACYLEVPIKTIKAHVKLLNRNLVLEHKREANKQIDLLMDLDGVKINIELQNEMANGIKDRNVVYACRIHGGQLKLEEDSYVHIKKTLQINLVRGVNEVLKESYYLVNDKGRILTKKLQIDFIDIEKGSTICYTEKKEHLACWCKVFLATTIEELKKALESDLLEMETRNLLASEMDKYSREEEVVVMYSKYTKEELERQCVLEERTEEARVQGIKEGIKEGIEQGQEKTQLEIAKEMLDDNMDIQAIAKYTKLSMEEILKLRSC